MSAILIGLLSLLLPYLPYILLGILAIYFINKWINMKFKVAGDIRVEKNKEKRELRKEEQAKLDEEKRRLAHRIVGPNNWLLKEITKTRIIIIKGLAGKGKSLFKSVLLKFLTDQFERDLRKNKRYYEIMNPQFLKRREDLKRNGYLPIYTNATEDLFDERTGLKAQPGVMDIITQRKKSNSPAIIDLEEIGEVFSKRSVFQIMNEKDKEKQQDNAEMKDLARKIRHYGLWLITTEQNGTDVVMDIGQFGYASPTAIETRVSIHPIGRRKQAIKLFFIKWMPGWLVSSPRKRLLECLTFKQKLKTFFKLFLPAGFNFEKQYFTTRNSIYENTRNRYTYFKLLLEFEGKLYWLHFGHGQKLSYNTTVYKKPYDAKFDADGNRKVA